MRRWISVVAAVLAVLLLAGQAAAQADRCTGCPELAQESGATRATALARAPAAQGGNQTVIYFFWGDGCPHCAAAKPFLARLARTYPGVQIRDFEVWYNEANREPFIQMAARFGFEPTGVPTIFIGQRYWIGFSERPIGQEIAFRLPRRRRGRVEHDACPTDGRADACAADAGADPGGRNEADG